jgi:hypothetical protein
MSFGEPSRLSEILGNKISLAESVILYETFHAKFIRKPVKADVIFEDTKIIAAYKRIELQTKRKKGKLKITFQISSIPGKTGCKKCRMLKELEDSGVTTLPRICSICIDTKVNYISNIYPKVINKIDICPVAFLYYP